MSTASRFGFMAVGVGLLAAVTVLTIQAKPDSGPANLFSSPVTLQINRQAQQVMAKGRELIDEKEFAKACEALQYLLALKDDNWVQVAGSAPGQKDQVLHVSIRSEANRLLGTLPAEGLKVYEQLYGREAAARLNEGRTAADPQILAEVAQRYFHTQAGAQATELLATRCLERDEFLMAALYFERLLARPDAGRLNALTLFKAALAFHRARDRGNGEEAWKLLTAKAKRDGGVSLGEQVVRLDRLREEIGQVAEDAPNGVRDWPNYRGTPNRSGQALVGKIDLGNASWKLSTLCQKGGDPRTWNEDLVNTGLRSLEEQNQPILPSQHPIAVGGKVLLRTYDGIYAADLHGKDTSNYPWWGDTDGGVKVLLSDENRRPAITSWWNIHQNQGYKTWGPQSIVFQNSVTGTLSTDGARVFLVDDLVLPPHPFNFQLRNFGGMPVIPGAHGAAQFGPLQDQAYRNSLKCYNLESGKIMWYLGPNPKDEIDPLQQQFKRSLFLGPPLPLNGKLYVLNENDGAIRLICLAAKEGNDDPQPPELLWQQTLAETKDRVAENMIRRIYAAHVSYGEGFLVCPTNAGAVVTVDLLSHSLVWAHFYREAAPPPPGGRFRRGDLSQLINEWRHSAPAIAEGKVVFTAPDADDIVCLNLRDGRLVWKHPRAADDLYFAGIYQGKAMVVGKNYVRALKLTDGTDVWDSSEATGTPTGQGVAAGNLYYLPARNASKQPEIVTIDLADGKVTSHIKPEKKDLLGNLIFHDGFLISQTANSIAAFPLK